MRSRQPPPDKSGGLSLPNPGKGGRDVWPVDGGPTAYIDRSDGISRSGEPARYAGEKGLRRTVTLIDTTAYRTGVRGVSWVNQFHDHTGEACLVLDKAPELVESPGVLLPPLALANRDPVPDTFEVFKGNAAAGVFGLCNEPLADYVVGIGSKAILFARALLEKSPGCLRAIGLELCAQFGMALSKAVHLATGVGFAVRISGDIDDAKVNTQKAFRVIRMRLRGINNHSQVEGLVSEDKVGLPYDAVDPGLLISTDAHRNQLPAIKGEDRYPVCSLPGEDPLVVDHGAMGIESLDSGLVPAVDFNDFTHHTYSHLGRKAVVVTKVVVGKTVELYLTGGISLKSKVGDVVTGLIESLHRLEQGLVLLWARSKFHHQCLFHASIIDYGYQYIKGGEPAFLCRLKTTVSCEYFL